MINMRGIKLIKILKNYQQDQWLLWPLPPVAAVDCKINWIYFVEKFLSIPTRKDAEFENRSIESTTYIVYTNTKHKRWKKNALHTIYIIVKSIYIHCSIRNLKLIHFIPISFLKHNVSIVRRQQLWQSTIIDNIVHDC